MRAARAEAGKDPESRKEQKQGMMDNYDRMDETNQLCGRRGIAINAKHVYHVLKDIVGKTARWQMYCFV